MDDVASISASNLASVNEVVSSPAENNEVAASPSPEQSSEQVPASKIPSANMTLIEHPCIIRNIDKGIKSIGGNTSLNKFLNNNKPDKVLDLSLRPDDVQARYVTSKGILTNTVIFKITTPKWTGRKRKRGSDDSFQTYNDDGTILKEEVFDTAHNRITPGKSIPAQDLLHILREKPDAYTIAPVGRASSHHRFRNLPDHQYATSTDPFMQTLRAIQSYDSKTAKDFVIDPHRGIRKGLNVGLPPIMNLFKTPHVYSYKQSAHVKLTIDEKGNKSLVNTNHATKYRNVLVQANAEVVPQAPSPTLPLLSTLDKKSRQCIAAFKVELEKRPIMVKRVQEQLLFECSETHIRRAWPYVGYMFKQGPFRDAIIKFGVDPRTDSKYRIYQTLFYQLPEGPGGIRTVEDQIKALGDSTTNATATAPEPEPSSTAAPPADDAPIPQPIEDPNQKNMRTRYSRTPRHKPIRPKDSHLFTGHHLYRDGKTWQAIDILDPLLLPLVHSPIHPLTYDPDFCGWYCNGTWSALRVLLKEKIILLAAAQTPDWDMDLVFREVVAQVPASIDDKDMESVVPVKRPENWLPIVMTLVTRVRGFARMSYNEKKNRDRYIKGQLAGEGEIINGDGDGEVEIDPDLEGGEVGAEDRMDIDGETSTVNDAEVTRNNKGKGKAPLGTSLSIDKGKGREQLAEDQLDTEEDDDQDEDGEIAEMERMEDDEGGEDEDEVMDEDEDKDQDEDQDEE